MFIRINNKLINPALVASGEIGQPTPRGYRPVTLHDREGKPLATIPDSELDRFEVEIVIAGPVPAIFIADDGAVTAAAIVAWRLRHGAEAEPIFLGPQPRGHMFMHMQGGALLGVGQFAELFKDLKAAVAAVCLAAELKETVQ